MLTRCPLCGSELECSTTPGKVWCCSPECGACFEDLDLDGWDLDGWRIDEKSPPGSRRGTDKGTPPGRKRDSSA